MTKAQFQLYIDNWLDTIKGVCAYFIILFMIGALVASCAYTVMQ